MENNKMIVLGGGAMACFALGYLGLHYMGGESLDDTQNLKTTSQTEVVTETPNINSTENVITENLTKIKEDVKEEITKTAEKIETGWGQFWKGAYEESSNEASSSDYN